MQLTKQEAERLGLLGENDPTKAPERLATKRKPKRGGVGIPRAGQAERTGLSTMIKLGWSVQSPDSVRYRLYVINDPSRDTGLCADELSACNAAKQLEKMR